jgi:hypothetical protein
MVSRFSAWNKLYFGMKHGNKHQKYPRGGKSHGFGGHKTACRERKPTAFLIPGPTGTSNKPMLSLPRNSVTRFLDTVA